MGGVRDRKNWLSGCTVLQGTFLRNRVLRKRLTILELGLYSQVLPQQIHHHSLHVASDATSVPRRAEKVCTEKPDRLTLLNNRLFK